MLPVGTPAPDFELPDQNGEPRSLKDFAGKRLILYFYSKDMTSGCSKQACGFAELYPQFTEKNAEIVGVSRDSAASHKKFEAKFGLPFTLLSDPDLTAIKAYDVWQAKKAGGELKYSVVRTTYLIEDGMIVKAFGKVSAAENPAQMLGEL